MTRVELIAALQALAEQRASNADFDDINVMITALARWSGHASAFIKSNNGHRMHEIRAARWRDQQRDQATE